MFEVYALSFIFLINFSLVGYFFMLMVRLINQGKFKRNRWIGLRTPSLMASDENWEKGHHLAAPGLQKLAYTCFVFAASHCLVFSLPQDDAKSMVVVVGLTQCALMIAGLFWVALQASRGIRAGK